MTELKFRASGVRHEQSALPTLNPTFHLSKYMKEWELSMTTNLSSEVHPAEQLISQERFATYKALTGDENDALELHQQVMMLNASLHATSGMIEIALRNSIWHKIGDKFETPDWLRSRPLPFRLISRESNQITQAEKRAKRAAYAKLSNSEKKDLDQLVFSDGRHEELSHVEMAKRRQSAIDVSDGQVIAQLTIYFWKNLFAESYEPSLWKPCLKEIFPNKTYKRSDISKHLEILYQTRNRLAHHEPVYGKRLENIVNSIEFMAINLGSRRPSEDCEVAKFTKPLRIRMNIDVENFHKEFARLTT